MKRITVFLVAMLMLAGVMALSPAVAEEVTTITWYVPGAAPQNYDNVMAAVNEKLAAHGLKLNLHIVEFGDYATKMQLISAAREECDIMWVASWLNSFSNNVSNGALMPIDEYLDEVPQLKELLDIYWQYMKVGGKVYGVPVLQIMSDQPGVVMLKDLVEKHKLDVTSVRDYLDLDPLLETIKANEPGIYPAANANMVPANQFYNRETGTYDYYPTVEEYYIDLKTMQVLEEEERLALELKTATKKREWFEKEYFHPDLPTMTDLDAVWKSGQAFAKYGRFKPGVEVDVYNRDKLEVVAIPTGNAYISVGSARSTVNGIASASKNPVKALKLLELVNTDKELYNMLVFGLEGQDYNWVDDTHIEKVDGGYSVAAWVIGNQFNAYYTVGQPEGLWEETIALNESAAPDPMGDFSFDRSKIENQIANVNAIREEYKKILHYGLDDPAKMIAEREEKLAAAGQAEILAEINRQLAEHMANR